MTTHPQLPLLRLSSNIISKSSTGYSLRPRRRLLLFSVGLTTQGHYQPFTVTGVEPEPFEGSTLTTTLTLIHAGAVITHIITALWDSYNLDMVCKMSFLQFHEEKHSHFLTWCVLLFTIKKTRKIIAEQFESGTVSRFCFQEKSRLSLFSSPSNMLVDV